MTRKASILPSYSIKRVSFENFKGIKNLEMSGFPVGAPWIFITGENGYGKTSVLQALAAALNGKEAVLNYYLDIPNTSGNLLLISELHGTNSTYRVQTARGGLEADSSSHVRWPNMACYGSAVLIHIHNQVLVISMETR